MPSQRGHLSRFAVRRPRRHRRPLLGPTCSASCSATCIGTATRRRLLASPIQQDMTGSCSWAPPGTQDWPSSRSTSWPNDVAGRSRATTAAPGLERANRRDLVERHERPQARRATLLLDRFDDPTSRLTSTSIRWMKGLKTIWRASSRTRHPAWVVLRGSINSNRSSGLTTRLRRTSNTEGVLGFAVRRKRHSDGVIQPVTRSASRRHRSARPTRC